LQPSGTTLFIEGKSWLHANHPFNKLSYLLLTGGVAYCAPRAWVADVLLLGLNTLFAAMSGILPAFRKITWRALLPLALFMIPIHGCLYPGNQTPVAAYDTIVFYLEGLQFAGTTLMQLAAILTASLLFVFTTHPADFITALTQARWPSSIAYLMGSPLLMLPAMRSRIDVILAAQQARGLDAQGSLLKRIWSLAPLAAPLILGALTEIEQRAIALELRGFNCSCKKTSLRIVTDSYAQRVARWLMLFVSLIIVLHRLMI
jgi:energy-coupling factor transport system permease protein